MKKYMVIKPLEHGFACDDMGCHCDAWGNEYDLSYYDTLETAKENAGRDDIITLVIKEEGQ